MQGDSFSVTLRLDDNLVEHVLVERTGSTLRIGLRDGSSETSLSKPRW